LIWFFEGLAFRASGTTIKSGTLDPDHLVQEVAMMSVRLESYVHRDEEILRNTFSELIVRAGVLLGWLVLITAICFSVLLLR
jgi:hypothetical protein